jgi:hypothetical protein
MWRCVGIGECLSDWQDRSDWNRFLVSVWKLDYVDTLDVRKPSAGPTAVNMKQRCCNCSIILHLRQVLQSGLFALLHTRFLHALFKTLQTENTGYLILIVTKFFVIRVSSECLESETNGNAKKNGFGKSEKVQIRTPGFSFESFSTVLHRWSHNKTINCSKLE